jgi:hypothetical protein
LHGMLLADEPFGDYSALGFTGTRTPPQSFIIISPWFS